MVEPEADHVELTVQRMAELHAEHQHGASALQRWVDAVTLALGRPRVVVAVVGLIGLWIAGNLLAEHVGLRPIEPPPFAWLGLAGTMFAVAATLLILATQRREEQATRHRSQLTLQLAALTEQKIAKVISLLEEQRRDSPLLESRSDREADEMGASADPRRVLDRIIDTHEGETKS